MDKPQVLNASDSSKPREILWFGCRACGYRPPSDPVKSNANWAVFQFENCPHCGEKMGLQIAFQAEART